MRQNRLIVPGYPHHVVNRGNNRRRLFSSIGDYHHFLWLVSQALLLHQCVLHALTLMSNHFHMIVTPQEADDMPRFMHAFSQRYAQRRNFAREGSGKLFDQRYFCEPIVSERQLAVTTAYIELNPVRAGMRDTPDYRWSTYGMHVAKPDLSWVKPSLWTPTDWYLRLGSTQESRVAAYAEWVAECRARDEKPARVTEIDAIEALSALQYTKRLERPNRTSAREPEAKYGLASRVSSITSGLRKVGG